MCNAPCQNGGTCVRPDACQCPTGYKGRYCEIDIDECREEKPCDQICRNVPGGYKCDCRETFILQPDGQSCRKEGNYFIFVFPYSFSFLLPTLENKDSCIRKIISILITIFQNISFFLIKIKSNIVTQLLFFYSKIKTYIHIIFMY